MIKLATPQGVIAFEQGRWVAETVDLTTLLNEMDFTALLPLGYLPSRTCAIAHMIADLLGGEVTDATETETDTDPNQIY
jgi:hypothetical protein